MKIINHSRSLSAAMPRGSVGRRSEMITWTRYRSRRPISRGCIIISLRIWPVIMALTARGRIVR